MIEFELSVSVSSSQKVAVTNILLYQKTLPESNKFLVQETC